RAWSQGSSGAARRMVTKPVKMTSWCLGLVISTKSRKEGAAARPSAASSDRLGRAWLKPKSPPFVVCHGSGKMTEPLGSHRTVPTRDRKSTRLNSSHVKISYAVFCLKKKKKSK